MLDDRKTDYHVRPLVAADSCLMPDLSCRPVAVKVATVSGDSQAPIAVV